ncbi:DUF6077 domain-containing protein [Actinomadura latina]|uniref:Uncharacterized protein n=1 Tax=Actinomadura latina TaxID=163603 RepID=A0A846Z0E0_9ACTN|nr:DUF6077 domain-containing protein [Actinomadura latina]NKZ05387.1 hypothetical protein [Actinomadura latina]
MVQLLDRVTATGGGGRPGETRTTRLVDGATDGLTVLFAVWTLVYHLGLLLRPPTSALLVVWLLAAGAIGALYGARRAWWDAPVRPPHRAGPAAKAPPRPLAVVAVVTGLAAGTAAGLHSTGVPWWCAWAPGIVSAAASAVWILRRAGAETPGGRTGGAFHAGRGDTRLGTPLALLTGAGFATASLFIVNSDGDDAYFVSRSVATAATGEIPLRDVIFTPGTAGPIAGEPPVSSIEVLAGAVARLFGIPGASFVWYLVLPLVSFLAVWATWRLARAWAPRNAALCFAVASVYLLWTGTSAASLGSFHLLRMWQGKAVLVSVLVPLLFVYLTRWAERRSRTDFALLAAAGIAAVGLTSSAAFVVPLVAGAAAVALAAAGRVRTAVAACVAMAYPVGSGIVVMLYQEDTGVVGTVHDAAGSWRWVLLQSTLGVLAGCALWLAPWTARRGVPAVIVTGVAATLTLLIVPGVLESAARVSGAGQVLWRTMWLVPAPVLIGLLATVRTPAPGRRAAVRASLAALPAAALVIALVAGGTPVWSNAARSVVASRPSWKVSAYAVGVTRDVVGLVGPGSTVLMPTGFMRVVPLLTVRTQAVNPNGHYLKLLPVPAQAIDDRQVLTEAVRTRYGDKPGSGAVKAALERVGVDVACAWGNDPRGLALLREAGYGGDHRVRHLVCLFPPAR